MTEIDTSKKLTPVSPTFINFNEMYKYFTRQYHDLCINSFQTFQLDYINLLVALFTIILARVRSYIHFSTDICNCIQVPCGKSSRLGASGKEQKTTYKLDQALKHQNKHLNNMKRGEKIQKSKKKKVSKEPKKLSLDLILVDEMTVKHVFFRYCWTILYQLHEALVAVLMPPRCHDSVLFILCLAALF